MSKKEYLIKLLEKLEPIWKLSSWIKESLINGDMDDNLINALIQDIERAIKATKNQVNKDKFKKSFAALKQLEEDEKKQNESDLLTIESLLSEI